MNRRVTMEEVAAKAGVAASTVCRALSNSPQISEKTRERVRQTAEEMGYRPDPLISAFASRSRAKGKKIAEITTIAYVTNFSTADEWRENAFYAAFHRGAGERADALGYRLEHFWLREPGMTGARLSRILYNRGISAVCVAPTPRVRGHLSLDWKRFSCVTMGYSVIRPDLHRTTPHHYHAVIMAVRELRRLGYRRVGLCMFAGTSRRVDDQWFSGWLLCQKQFTDMHLPYFLFSDESRQEIGSWARAESLEAVLGGEQPVHAELRRAGLFPGSVDYATLSWFPNEPGIAGIDQRPEAIGMAAIDVVIGQLQRGERGVPEFAMTAMIEGRWVSGPSAPGRR